MNSIRRAKPRDINVVIVNMDMMDATVGHDPEQKDVDMVDVPRKCSYLVNWTLASLSLKPK